MGKVDSIQIPLFEADGPEYEADYCAWIEEQGRRLRLLRIPGVDTDNIAEEIEGLARSDKRQIASRMKVLLTHMLKWRYQPSRAGNSWKATIVLQRQEIGELLEESPSLRPSIGNVVQQSYKKAVVLAASESGMLEASFPIACEWAAEEVLSPDFFPEQAT